MVIIEVANTSRASRYLPVINTNTALITSPVIIEANRPILPMLAICSAMDFDFVFPLIAIFLPLLR